MEKEKEKKRVSVVLFFFFFFNFFWFQCALSKGREGGGPRASGETKRRKEVDNQGESQWKGQPKIVKKRVN